MGGGFQVYFRQNRDASINLWQTKVIAPLAQFCRARQAVCHKAQPVPQVALFRSAKAWYRRSPAPIAHTGCSGNLHGVLNYLLETQHSVEVLSEHQLMPRLGEYPLVVVPDEGRLPADQVRRLTDYARKGGQLLLAGPGLLRPFARAMGVRLSGKLLEPCHRAFEWAGRLAAVRTSWQEVRQGGGVKVFAWSYADDSARGGRWPAAVIARLGRGRIGAMCFEPGHSHHKGRQSMVRTLLGALADELMGEPIVRVRGSQHVDVSLMRKDSRLMVNLVNTAGPHDHIDVYTHDDIPPVGPLEISIRLARRPRRIVLQPAGRAMKFEYSKGLARVNLRQLEIHDVIVVEP
jgi:hypothetical protein